MFVASPKSVAAVAGTGVGASISTTGASGKSLQSLLQVGTGPVWSGPSGFSGGKPPMLSEPDDPLTLRLPELEPPLALPAVVTFPEPLD
jgi:hypothetical protein